MQSFAVWRIGCNISSACARAANTLGRKIGLIRSDRQQRRNLDDGGMVSLPQRCGRVIRRRRQQAGVGIDGSVIRRRGEIDGRLRRR
jgi:hypothetical protein